MQFYRYRLMIHSVKTVNIIHRMGRLLHQYIVDMYVKIEGERLSFLQNNQRQYEQIYIIYIIYLYFMLMVHKLKKKRLFCHQVLQEVLDTSTKLYQNAMAIVRHFGKPDFFITFTCNPQWKEITDELLEYQTPADHPDLVSRVFKIEVAPLFFKIYTMAHNTSLATWLH